MEYGYADKENVKAVPLYIDGCKAVRITPDMLAERAYANPSLAMQDNGFKSSFS